MCDGHSGVDAASVVGGVARLDGDAVVDILGWGPGNLAFYLHLHPLGLEMLNIVVLASLFGVKWTIWRRQRETEN